MNASVEGDTFSGSMESKYWTDAAGAWPGQSQQARDWGDGAPYMPVPASPVGVPGAA